jgi:hypothetical protein
MPLHLMQVPASLLAAVQSGSALVDGAVVKDVVSGRILAHLQPTQALTNLVLEHGLGAVSQPWSLVSSLVGNAQLLQLKQLVETVQLVASIGAAASVVNLGISVGGFAMVLRSLKRVERKVDSVSTTLTAMSGLHHAEFMGRCTRALRQADEAFLLSREAERLRYWREADSELGALIEMGHGIIAKQGLALEGVQSQGLADAERLQLLAQPRVLDSLRWLMAFSAARTEVLLCLGEPGAAARVAARSVDWLRLLPDSAKVIAQAAMADEPRPPSLVRTAVTMAKATSVLVKEGLAVASSRVSLYQMLDDGGTDTATPMRLLHGATEPMLLAWMPTDHAQELPA